MTLIPACLRSLSFIFPLIILAFNAQAQTPCENGSAEGYACGHIDLMSFMDLSTLQAGQNVNDIWGWTDQSSGREFVLCGAFAGTAFVEITDPVNPVMVGFLPTHTQGSLWRDVKTYSHYAFIVSEAGGHGMQVFDLNHLLDATDLPVTFSADAHYDSFGKAHNIVINESTGYAYSVGSNTFSGGLHIIDISDPLNPGIAGGFDLDGYTHDAQVVFYNGPDTDYQGREIAFACNNDAITIVDVEDKTDCQMISTRTYENLGYVHQGWLTPDQRYFLMGDELDEIDFGHNTRTYIWDCEDLDNPVLMGYYESGNTAIDHNLYTLGTFCYQSNYRSGLRILDISDVSNANLSEVAFFDIYPEDDNAMFSGSWSNYPYFPSGNIAITSMYSGLFILKPNFYNLTANGPTTFCGQDELSLDLEIYVPLNGSFSVSAQGLPGGVSITGELESAPGVMSLSLSGLSDLPEGEYPIVIMLNSDLGFTESFDFSFTIEGAAPAVFDLQLPLDDAILVFNEGISFNWDTADGADAYILNVYADTPFTGDLVLSQELDASTTEFEVPADEWGLEGTFFWVVEAVNECGTTISAGVYSFSGMYVGVEEWKTGEISLYPNPSTGVVYLKMDQELNAIRVVNAMGAELKILQAEPGTLQRFDLSDLPAGTYYLRIGNSVLPLVLR